MSLCSLLLLTCACFLANVVCKDVWIDPKSCASVGPLSSADFTTAVLEAVGMAKRARDYMDDAKLNEDSTEGRRTRLVTGTMLDCYPGEPSCDVARSFLDKVAQLSIIGAATPADDDLKLFCNEDGFYTQLRTGRLTGHGGVQTTQCNGPNDNAWFVWPDVIILCPRVQTLPTVVQGRESTIGPWQDQYFRTWHIDNLETISSILLHELLHAASVLTRRAPPKPKYVIEGKPDALQSTSRG